MKKVTSYMPKRMLALLLLVGCDAADDETYRSFQESCEFMNDGWSMPEFTPDDGDYSYIFRDSLVFPPAAIGGDIDDVWEVLWKKKSSVYWATSEDTTYRKLASLHDPDSDIGPYPYKKNWYMWLTPDDETGRLSSFAFIKGEPYWDDDIDWFKLRTKMTHVSGAECETRTRTVWVDNS